MIDPMEKLIRDALTAPGLAFTEEMRVKEKADGA